MSSPKSPWQAQTTNFLSSPGIQSWTLGPSNQRPPPLCNIQVLSSTFVKSFLLLFSSPPWITCSSLISSWKPAGENEKSLAKVIYPKQRSKFNFCLTPDLDVNQLGGDVGGSQLPHVEEGSGHVPAHHLYLPLPSLSGQIFSILENWAFKIGFQVLARILSFLMLYLFERNFFPAVSTTLKLTCLISRHLPCRCQLFSLCILSLWQSSSGTLRERATWRTASWPTWSRSSTSSQAVWSSSGSCRSRNLPQELLFPAVSHLHTQPASLRC